MDQKISYDFDTVISRAGTHAEKYESRQKYFGHPTVEPFWVADMDLPTPDFLMQALRKRLDHPMLGYTEQYDDIFNSICWWMKSQHGAEVQQKEISLSPSVVTTISLVIQTFTKPGEAVALLSPVYGPFFGYTQQNGRRIADCPLHVENGRFEIDFTALENQLAQDDVTLLLLCNPQNPGGRVWTEKELLNVAELCSKHQVVIFSDEIHCDIVFPPARHVSMLNIETARNHLIMAHSIGKTFNTSGLQASFTIIPNADLRSRFRKTADRAHTADINLLGKVALAEALSPAGAEYKHQLVNYIHENTKEVCSLLNSLTGLEVMPPEATFLVWSDFRTFGTWQEVFKKLIHEADVALSGGTFFGPAGEGWFRINCAHPRSKLLPAVERIAQRFQKA